MSRMSAQRADFIRRTKASLVFVIVCLVLATVYSSGAVSASSGSSNQALTPIKHVIVVTMENHSFDNLFGVYPFGGNSTQSGIVSNLTVPSNLASAGLASGLSAVPTGQVSTSNPVEGYTAYHLDWNNGQMNGFRANSGPQSMTYFTAAQMSPEWALAQQFAIGGMYFSSTLTATMPNRLYSIAGYSPVINDYGLPPYIPFSQSIFGELQNYGVSWSYYIAYPSAGLDVLSYLQGISAYGANIRSWNAFQSELSSNTLPSVSYVSPIGVAVSGYSQHPSDSVVVGEMWLYAIVNSVMHSPEWNSTAIFINYDEGGGYYDQVAPPVTGGQQLGFRVPLIVVSPYAKEDYVSSTIMNHASLLAFIDYNWNMPPLNRFVSYSNLPLDMFYGLNGSSAPRAPVTLQSAGGFTVPTTLYFSQSTAPTGSLSSMFPAAPQIQFSQLPYARTGSSSTNLSRSGGSVYVQSNSPYTPFYESDAVLASAMALLLIGSFLVIDRSVRRK